MSSFIKINGITVDPHFVNFINIAYVSDENNKMYITIDLGDKGIIKTISNDIEDVEIWDQLTDVSSVMGTKKELLSELW